jgi:aldehyde dehydrogenase (NAD+)
MKDLKSLIENQRRFFLTGRTRDVSFRIEALKRLKQAVESHEQELYKALDSDLRKPAMESFMSEIGMITREISFVMRHLRSWTRPEKARTNLLNFPARSRIYAEPYGVTLIIGPWNYPLQLTLLPLIGAIAAGNCSIVKPSEIAHATSGIVAKIIGEACGEEHVAAVEGGKEVGEQLLAERFDHIFFTGSAAVGRIVMQAASQHLTPVTMELGGKSPAIVDADADLSMAARRIAWGKFLNAGQTCVAPDYLLLHAAIKDPFLALLRTTIKDFYGDDPQKSPDYARIVNNAQFDRLAGYLRDGDILIGGEIDRRTRYIGPTVLLNSSWDARVMQEEIFGPLLPVLIFDDLDDVIGKLISMPRPLSLYYFSRNRKKQKRIIRDVPFGGGTMNDTILHMVNPHLPFGGAGQSGFGSYHGKASFDAFSHRKSILARPTLLDNPLRYPPYAGKLRWLKKFFTWDR